MKKLFYLCSMISFALTMLLVSCSRNTYPHTHTTVIIGQPENMPPGQAKKLYGQQSAKEFAPGQQKKKSREN